MSDIIPSEVTTWTGPPWASEGIVAVIEVFDQAVVEAFTGGKGPVEGLNPPENSKVPVAEPKFIPEITTELPLVAEDGEIEEMVGMTTFSTVKALVE